jgi:hypothetical protein
MKLGRNQFYITQFEPDPFNDVFAGGVVGISMPIVTSEGNIGIFGGNFNSSFFETLMTPILAGSTTINYWVYPVDNLVLNDPIYKSSNEVPLDQSTFNALQTETISTAIVQGEYNFTSVYSPSLTDA